MPYIKDTNNRRQQLRDGYMAESAGELNFKIFVYVKECGDKTVCYAQIQDFVSEFLGRTPNYQKFNDMTGALIRCSKEIKRRLGFDLPVLAEIMHSYDEEIADYEDLKIVENGDV